MAGLKDSYLAEKMVVHWAAQMALMWDVMKADCLAAQMVSRMVELKVAQTAEKMGRMTAVHSVEY